jgi:HK97 family phage major capsid protein
MSDLAAVMKALDGLESKLSAAATKAAEEAKSNGKMSTESKSALEALGNEQKSFADRLLQLEQKGVTPPTADADAETPGQLFIKNDKYQAYQKDRTIKNVTMVVKNTISNAVAGTFSDRKLGVVGGAFRNLTVESLMTTVPTTSNAIDYVREASFVNNAAETTEGAVKPESVITYLPVTEPVGTIAHFIKITKQLAQDNAAMRAYIDQRMMYGVNLRVENQIIAGNGTAPNLSGLTKAGNFTPHGYTAAGLTGAGLLNNRFDLIGKILGDSQANDFSADMIMLNPADWWTMRLGKDSQGRYLLGDPGLAIAPGLFGKPVTVSNAIPAGNVLVLSLADAGTFHRRDEIELAMSEHDTDNFQRNLITLRAERRCAMAVERPAAVRYGLLVPA